MLAICIVLAAISCLLIFYVFKLTRESSDLRGKLEIQTKNSDRLLKEIKESYERQISELKAGHAERIEQERQAIGEKFKALASDILQANSRQLDERSRLSVETVLAPIKTQLEEFTRGFRDCYSFESQERLTMREEIKRLHELNTIVSAETSRLTQALKGNTRIQGQWGEMVLKNILEHSGLESGEWFITQDRSTTSDGDIVQPDAIIRCPGERVIIIDSKASLTSYFAYLEATDDDERDKYIKAHVRSVENHIKVLCKKDYQSKVGANKGDFVFMFMPHEGAFLAAMRAKPDLWQNAYDSRVVLASPTHLVTTLQLVEQMWKAEKQSINSQLIAEQGTKLLESIAAFLKELSDIGINIRKAQESYDEAVRRLETSNNNVVRVAQRLSDLGIKSKRSLPRPFTKSDQ